MPFPVSRSFSLALPTGTGADSVLPKVLRALSVSGAEHLRMEEGEGRFEVPWTVAYGPLWGIQRGRFEVTADSAGAMLRCRVSLTRNAAATAALVALWLATEWWFFHPAWSQAAIEGLVTWLWLWGLGYLWVAWKFRRFVRRAVSNGGAI